ncbi:MAG: tRNA lysidine(34) synthetase TilS [Pseudomonadales bacterium]|nr:tRNA lysidine(34) synthetase TilS [Pseudomonadales bacterium]
MADTSIDHGVLDKPLEPLLDARHWYVGFSGGIDSTVLLHLLQRWCRQHPNAPRLSAIHVNHGLHAEAAEWQAHCEWLCRLLQIPILCLDANVERGSLGLEAAAREARYALFEEQLSDGDVLFLGHHADDQVETFFLRLLRGAGVQGLAAMPAGRTLGAGRLARPLLQQPRAALEAYAAAHGLNCVQDPSNFDTALDRNFLRAEVLPLLARRWPGYRATVLRASAHIGVAAEQLARSMPAPATIRSEMGDPGLRLGEINTGSPREAMQALRHWLLGAGWPAPDQAALAEFQRQLETGSDGSRSRLQCSAYTLQRYRDAIYLLPDPGPAEASGPMSLAPGETLELPGSAGRAWLAQVAREGLRLAPGERLRVAWREGGERCRPLGRGGSASLKKVLQERGVPPWWRDRVPLFYLGEELLAVGDLWLCDSSRWSRHPGPGEQLWQPRWERNITTAFD